MHMANSTLLLSTRLFYSIPLPVTFLACIVLHTREYRHSEKSFLLYHGINRALAGRSCSNVSRRKACCSDTYCIIAKSCLPPIDVEVSFISSSLWSEAS